MSESHGEPRDRTRWRLPIYIVAVGAATLAVHWPALSSTAFSLDDKEYLRQNALVKSPSWESARRFIAEVRNPSSVRGYYQPLTMISLMLDVGRGGSTTNLRPFREANLALHIANVALIILVLNRLFRCAPAAALGGLLFAVHPLTVEPVVWLCERKTLLATLFALAAILVYVSAHGRPGWGRIAICAVLFALALLAKPTVTPLPVLLLLLDYWPLRRLALRSIVRSIPLFAVAALSACVTVVSQASARLDLPGEAGRANVVLLLCHNLMYYVFKVVWPSDLTSYYVIIVGPTVADPLVLAGVIGLPLLLAGVLIAARWTKAPLVGFAFYALAIFPTLGLLGFTPLLVSPKYFYFPALGLLLPVTALLASLWRRPRTAGPPPQREGAVSSRRVPGTSVLATVIVIGAATACAVGSRHYHRIWRDSVSLFADMLRVKPDVANLHVSYAYTLSEIDHNDEAVRHYRRALELAPGHVDAHVNFGLLLARLGQSDAARVHLEAALRGRPAHPEAHYALGVFDFAQQQLEPALAHFAAASDAKADYVDAWFNRAAVLAELGRLAEARAAYETALGLAPHDAEIRARLAALPPPRP